MARQPYKQAYETAKRDLLKNLEKRDRLDREIRKLKDTLKALGEICGIDPAEIDGLLQGAGFAMDGKLGFTEAIRRLFRAHQTTLSPLEIRDGLLKMSVGVDQVNLLSSIHTVLRRMAEAGEIEKTADAKFRACRIKS
jgi:hypothetical protein